MNDLADIAFAGPPGPGLTAEQEALVQEAIAAGEAATAGAANITATSGEKLLETSVLTGTSGGAVPIVVGGRTVGFTIPIGQNGAGSNVVPRIPFTYEEAQRLAGSTIRLRVVMEATAGYLASTPFAGNAVRVDRQNGAIDQNEGVALPAAQTGTRLTRDYTYVMVGDERLIGPTIQIGPNASTTAIRSFEVKSIVWDVIATPATAGATGADAALDTRLAALEPAADIFGKVEPIFQFFNDAVAARDDGGRTVGSTIPAGKSGQNTIMQWRLPMNGRLRKMLPGRQARITLGFDTPSGWARAHTINMQVRDVNLATTAIVATEVIDKQISPTRRVISFNFLTPTGMVLDDLRPYIALTDASNASASETIALTDMVMGYYRNGSDVMQEAANTALLGDEFTRGASVEQAVGTVFATGKRLGALLDAASYASIALALQTATALASPGAMAQVNVGEGVFTERSLGLIGSGTDGDNIILRGAGKGRTIIDARLPPTTPIATIQATSGFDFNRTQEISDGTLWVGNMRYGAHIDSVNFAPDSRNIWRNFDIVHFGNDAADAYWGQSVWTSQHAWALGTTSGSYYGFDNCGGRAPRAAFSAHDQIGFTSPSIVEWVGGPLTATNTAGWCFRLESIGSMLMNRAVLANSPLTGDISMAVQPWLPTALDQQPADHRCWELVGHGNSPAVFRIEDFGRALRITSLTTGVNSRVVLSGSAVPILFGKTGTTGVTRVDGDVGMAGYAYGWGDISADTTSGRPGAITSLPARLNDRTGASVTLTVQIDAFAAVNIVLNANYSAMTQAQVIALLNAALAGKAVVSEYNVGERYRPFFSDEEARFLNTSGTMILMGMALALDEGGARTVRPMTSADPFTAFAGVAWQDIRPSQFGRVKTGGWIDRSDVLRSDGGWIDVGERFTIDPAKPGYVISGVRSGAGILNCVRALAGQDLTALEVMPSASVMFDAVYPAAARGAAAADRSKTANRPNFLDRMGGTSIEQIQHDLSDALVRLTMYGEIDRIDTLAGLITQTFGQRFMGKVRADALIQLKSLVEIGGAAPQLSTVDQPEWHEVRALREIRSRIGLLLGFDGRGDRLYIGDQTTIPQIDGTLWRHPDGSLRVMNKPGWYTGQHSFLSEPVPPPQCILRPVVKYVDQAPELASRVYILIPSVARIGNRLFFAWCGDAAHAEEGAGNFIILAYSDNGGATKTEFAYVQHPEPTLGRTMMPQLWVDLRGRLQLVFSMNYAFAGIAGGDDRHGAWCMPIDFALGAKPRCGRAWQISTYGIPGRPFLADDRMLVNIDLVENATAGLPAPGPIPAWRGKAIFEINPATRSAVRVGRIANSETYASYQESSTVQLRDGSLLAMFRTRTPGSAPYRSAQISRSPDGDPANFGALQDFAALPSNPTTRAALAMSANGRPLVAFNSDPSNRTSMTLAVLNDEATSILQSILIDQMGVATSYPSIWSEGDDIHVIYDRGRDTAKQIILAKVSEAALVAGTATVTFTTIEDQ